MNKTPSKAQIVGISVLAGVLLSSVTVLAVTLPNQATSYNQVAQTRLQGAKLRACQAREDGIKNRSTHLVDLVKNIEDKFDSIAKKVEDYYTNKVVPSGKTITNYDTLVSDIIIKKTAVDASLTKAQNSLSALSCTSDNPKDTIMKFKDDMQAVKQALKDYRTSIKNLIVAIHSVIGTTERQTACQSACQRSCGADASCLTECYGGCRGAN